MSNTTYEVLVSGADNANIPYDMTVTFTGYSLEYPTFESARDEVNAQRDQWLADGYHLTAANIFIKGDGENFKWRRVALHERNPEYGTIVWYPTDNQELLNK